MLGRLLTPLVTPLAAVGGKFDLSAAVSSRFPGSALSAGGATSGQGATGRGGEDEANPEAEAEDFARDVLIEVMRNSVEALKKAETVGAKVQAMGEIHRIMVEDACTKDVFRELDGFLLIVNLLAILHVSLEGVDGKNVGSGSELDADADVCEGEGDACATMTLTEEGERLAFMLLAESLKEHPRNQRYFETHVGYESLAQALVPLVKDRRTVDQLFGSILSVALDNFALSGIFSMLREKYMRARNSDDGMSVPAPDFSEYKTLLSTGTVRHARMYALLLMLLSYVPEEGEDISGGSNDDNDNNCVSFLPHAVYSLTDVLVSLSHRNKAALSSCNTSIFDAVFEKFVASETKQPALQNMSVRPMLQKLMKKLLDIGAADSDVRRLFQRAVREDRTLNSDVLEVIRSGMRAKWPVHFSMLDSASFVVKDEAIKGLPSGGFTFMIWLWIEQFKLDSSLSVLKVEGKNETLFHLSLRADGMLELRSSENKELAVLENTKIAKAKWTHLALVHHPHQTSNPTIRIFVDGIIHDTRNWAYPRADSNSQSTLFIVGNENNFSGPALSWCLSSCYLISQPLPDDIPRLVQLLGPRYSANFQAKDLTRFLTYDASTSLNIFLFSLVSQRSNRYAYAHKLPIPAAAAVGVSPLTRAIKDGIGVAEEAFVFSINPNGYDFDEDGKRYLRNGVSSGKPNGQIVIEVKGDVLPVMRNCLDIGLWRTAGSSVALRLIELASTPHELSRSLGIFTDCSRRSWQMSENMERLNVYRILAHILRLKSQIMNVTAFETLFEFLGLNFRTPDQSVITNDLAYCSLALDFEIWAYARPDIQRVHLEHFSTLLKTSKHRKFNSKQRMVKFGTIRKMLYVLQANWYSPEMIPQFVSALRCVAQACFTAEETIKPIVSYLAANLHDVNTGENTPKSSLSRLDRLAVGEKAEQVLRALVFIISSESNLAKFSAALPLPRICLLLLGDSPSSQTAANVLAIIGLALKSSPQTFSRKFELVSGWTALKVVLPGAWNADVQKRALNIFLGRIGEKEGKQRQFGPSISCPQILPAIIAALDYGIAVIAQDNLDEDSLEMAATTESLLEELMELQASSQTFRHLFKSQQTSQLLVSSYEGLVMNGPSTRLNQQIYQRILEKMSHFLLAFTLDNVMSSAQKDEILKIFQKAERVLSTQQTDLVSAMAEESGTKAKMGSAIINVAQTGVQILSDRAYQKTVSRIRNWRQSIIESEKKRLQRTALDLREYRRHADQLNDWRNSLYDEGGLWTAEESVRGWLLDETEGPCRVRKKLARKAEVIQFAAMQNQPRVIAEPELDADSFVQVEIVVPPWAEGSEFSSSEGDQGLDEFADDKLRRVRHGLESGDVIEAVCTVTRIVGIDSSPGLLILGRTHLYMLDGLVENKDGEVIEACDAPRDLFTVPGSILELDGRQKAQRWSYNQVVSFSRKTCLFRDVAMELYFKDSRCLLLAFPDKKKRQEMGEKLATTIATGTLPITRSPLLQRTPFLGKIVFKPQLESRDELMTAQRKWQAREISNFTYLSVLNQTSGRTPADATQYPVFPWVLSDYSSDTLDLNNKSTFRDLTRPMGALSEARREAARQRYESLQSVGEKPFHYGTHFSSSMIVCHYLIRLEPFTHMFKTLQGGDWDLPDRLFSDMRRAYHSASEDIRGDVRELIPEFFTCPEFLLNSDKLDLGVSTASGAKIHDVVLPPWARGNPLLFVTEHRKALESDYVSENLPAWIDLIWGCKQRDVESLNVFHPLSYEGSIDLDSIADELEREATVGIIHNFGQTPRKLFDIPHPSRMMQGVATLPLGTQHGVVEDMHLLVQSPMPYAEIADPAKALYVDSISERIIPCPPNSLRVPQFPHEQVAWGFVDQSVRLLSDRKVVQVCEAVSCLCVAFVDSEHFVSGSSDWMLRLWQLSRKDGVTSLAQTHMLRTHTGSIICVAACCQWSIIASGSEDGTAVIWDLNRAVHVRTIDHKVGSTANTGCYVHLVAINESSGYVATCSETKLWLHTVNAYPIVLLDLLTLSANPSSDGGRITSLAFHEREYARLGLLATGTSTGVIHLRTWSAADTPVGERAQWKFVTLRTLRCRPEYDDSTHEVTSLQFIGETLYHGEENGKIYAWELPD